MGDALQQRYENWINETEIEQERQRVQHQGIIHKIRA